MQNFTFGRKGLNWLLFAFILFVGSASSYGQECYSLERDQSYCYLETIQDLINDGVADSDANTAIFETSDSENDTDPIDDDELLTDGETYFVGSTSDDSCTRTSVTVSVDDSTPTPMNTVTNDRGNFTISPCESSDYTAGQLEGLFTPDAGFRIEVYDTEFGTSPKADGEPLTAGDSYFVGQVDDDAADDVDECPSTRAAVGFDPIDAPAPIAEATQTFCDGATVADLVASEVGENVQAIRWYRSMTSNTPLDDDQELINGEDYFAAQVVNERNSPFPPCETPETERIEVVVNLIIFDAGDDISENICQEELQTRLETESPTEIFSSLFDGRDLPSEVSFNPSINTLVAQYSSDPFQTFVTTATFTTEEGCEDDIELALTVLENPDAGENGTVTLSPSDDPINLFDFLNGTPDTGGIWSPGDETFDPSTDTEGDFTYTVDNGTCSDSATVTVIVTDCEEAAPDNSITICNDVINEEVDDVDDIDDIYFSLLPEGTPTDGTFNPTTQQLLTRYGSNNFQDFTTTYSYTDGSCDYSTELTITIIEPEEANAGSFDNIATVCSSTDAIDLTTLTNNDPAANTEGTFTGTGITANSFDPSIGAGEYTITYTVADAQPCVTGTEDTTFTITVQEGDSAGDDNTDGNIVCSGNISTEDELVAYLTSLLSDDATQGGTFSNVTSITNDINNGLEGPFNSVYTVGEDTSCEDSANLSFSTGDGDISLPDNSVTFCNDEIDEAIDDIDDVDDIYFSLLPEGTPTDGTFNPTILDLLGTVQPEPNFRTLQQHTVILMDLVTYTADLTISIIEADPANAGNFDNIATVCSSTDAIDLTTLTNNDPAANTEGTFTGTGITANSFDPSIGAGEYTITYTVADAQPCVTGTEDTTFTITVQEGDSAGDDNTDGNIVCSGNISTEDELVAYLTSLLSDDATQGGTFSNVTSITNDINNGLEGPFNSVYTVGEDTSCEDSANLSFSTGDGDISLPDNSVTFCNDEIDEAINDIDDVDDIYFSLLPEGTPTDGTFNPSILDLLGQYNLNPIQDFTTTYSYTDGSCTYTADLTISIIEADPANAGNFDNIATVCSSTDAIDLTTLTNNDPAANTEGTFTGTGITANSFDPSIGAGEYTITYTVADAQPCVTGTEDTTFTITVQEGDSAGDDNTDGNIVCSGNISTEDELVAYLTSLLSDDATQGGTFSNVTSITNDINNGLEGPFNSVYTVGEDTSCEDSANLSFSAGDGDISLPDNSVTFCNDEIDEAIDDIDDVDDIYFSLLPEGTPTDGTFNPTIQQLLTRYNANNFQDFTTTYSYTDGSCTYSADLTISVIEADPANPGSIDNITVCSADDSLNLETLNNNDPDATMGGTFSGTGVSDNTFDPSVGEGTYTITYTVDESIDCVIGTASTTFDITVEPSPISTSISRSLCITEAQELIDNPAAGLAYLQELVEEAGVDSFDEDNFSDASFLEAARLLNFIENPMSDSETFNFEYTDPSDSVCEDGLITIDITINNLEEAEAGDIEDQTVCSTDGMIDLTDYFTSTTTPGGTFSGTGVADNMFDSSIGANSDGYVITYSVDDSADCVIAGTSDLTTFTIFVNEGVSAGADNSTTVCRGDVDSFDEEEAIEFYLDLLEAGVPTNGTFTPTITQIIEDFNENEDQTVFTTTYTITSGECSDSVDLTVNVINPIPAEIGDITDPDPICQNADDVDLFSFLPADANPNGTFTGYDSGVFSPSMEGAGTFNITYTLTDDSPCTDGEATADFTITVTEAAFAGMDVTVPTACTNDSEVDLNGSISVDADTDGVFTLDSTGEVIADGILDISEFEAGDYTITYTIAEINDCGDDDATLTLTVSEAPDGPTVDGGPFTFCAENNPTGADLTATGSNLTFYSDEALSTMVMTEDALTSGTYYVTQRAEEGECESNATEFTVTVNDADTPTISNTTLEFCDFEDPTIADLSAEIIESGAITWYDSADGDNDLSEGTPLQDGTIYYASLVDADSGCNSSVRLAVTAVVENCPVVVPEGFSPNDDQINDTFDIRFIEEVYPNYTIVIHNRYGDVVYKGNADTPDWDGFSSESAFGDDLLPVGAYFYYLDYKDGSTEPVRGTVYLSR